jgi:hypothetical protein
MANDDKGPNLEKRLDHQLEIEDDLDSEIHERTRYHVKCVSVSCSSNMVRYFQFM